MKMHCVRRIAAVPFVWAMVQSSTLGVEYRFVRIADSRDGPLYYDYDRHPAINNAGSVAFWQQHLLGGGIGYYVGNGGSTTPIVTDLSAPLSGLALHQVSLNDSGNIAFYADNLSGFHVFKATAAGTITVVAETGGGTFSSLGDFVIINNSGAVAFKAGSRAFINAGSGNLEVYGPTVPATGVAVGSEPFLNNVGQLSLSGSYGLAVGGYAHLRGSGGPPTIIADGTSTVTTYGNSSVNDSGTVLFGATTSAPGGQAIFTGFGGALSVIADNSSAYSLVALDSHSGFGAGGDPAINNSGTVAFKALVAGGTYGLFTGAVPATSRIIQAGSALFGRTVDAVAGLGREAINDSGEVAFEAQLLDGLGFSSVVVKAVPFTAMKWNSDSDGTWSNSAKWLGPVPNAYWHDANFTDAISAPRDVTVDGAFTVGSMNFDNASAYTLLGPGSITINDSTGGGQIHVISGHHIIDLKLSSPKLNLRTEATTSLEVRVSGLDGILNKDGTGSLLINRFVGAELHINAGAMTVLPNGGTTGTSKTGSLTIAGALNAWTAKLDLKDNDLIVGYSGISTVPAVIANQVKSGYAGGAWTGNGITTSLGDISTHALGYGDNALLGYANFSGIDVTASNMLVKYTYYGDANLDGGVDINDLYMLASHFNTSGTAWTGGDFNFDGLTNAVDLGMLAHNWQAGVGAPITPSLDAALAELGLPPVSVPEPGIGLLSVASALLARRRRRSC